MPVFAASDTESWRFKFRYIRSTSEHIYKGLVNIDDADEMFNVFYCTCSFGKLLRGAALFSATQARYVSGQHCVGSSEAGLR